MTETANGATGTQADPGTQPPAGTAQSQADGGSETVTEQPESISLEEAKKLRSEARSLRSRLAALEGEKATREKADLSEVERLRKEKADLEARLVESDKAIRDRTTRAALVAAAAKAGFADPEDAVVFLHDQVEYEEDGTPKGIDALVADLRKRKPNLLASYVRATGSIDGGTRGAPALTREQIDRMTPAEYATRRDEVMEYLSRKNN